MASEVAMQKDEELNQMAEGTTQEARSDSGGTSRAYKMRLLFHGFLILLLAFLAGIVVSFYQWDRGSPFDVSNWNAYNPVGRATYAPLLFTLVLFPITIPLLLILSIPIFIAMRKEKLWPLSLLSFLTMGCLWVWYLTTAWQMD